MNRADLMHRALRSGNWRSRHNIFNDCGRFFLTNNAASELRARGFTVEQRRKNGQFQYRLLGGAESRDSGHETARKPLSRIALRSSEQRDQALLKIASASDLAEAARAYIRGRVGESDNGVCWLWPVADSDGYGRAHFRGRTFRAPRLSYTVFIGPIPEGLTLDHLCRVRLCVNPAHLEPVTNHENLLRGEGFPGQNTRKTHCPVGHEYTPENTARYSNGRGSMSRRCRECWNAAKRLAYATSVGKTGEQAALPTAGKPLPTAACSPIQLELETESRFGSGAGGTYASGESRAA